MIVEIVGILLIWTVIELLHICYRSLSLINRLTYIPLTFEEMKATPEGAHHLLSGIGLNDKSEEKELAKIQATKDVLKEKIVEYQHILDVLENL